MGVETYDASRDKKFSNACSSFVEISDYPRYAMLLDCDVTPIRLIALVNT